MLKPHGSLRFIRCLNDILIDTKRLLTEGTEVYRSPRMTKNQVVHNSLVGPRLGADVFFWGSVFQG